MQLDMVSRRPETTPKRPPLLFVHGSFSDARVWDDYFLPYFAERGHEAHAVSLRGHGRSEGRERIHTWRLADYVADLAQAVAAMPQPPLLVGHSMGGMVIQKYMERAPAVAGVVLMGSVPPQGLLPSNLHMAMRHPFLFQQMALFSVLGPSFGSIDLMRRLLFSPSMPTELLRKFIHYTQPESQVVSLDMMGLDPLRLKPGRLPVPTLVLGAQHDIFVSPALVRETARFYRAECHVCPNMAHAMMLEANWREMADYLLGWIARAVEKRAEPAAA
ncbi:MAG: alpha/beta fold hydrolase [Candidatus Competibacteraceae bacterium]|nr:alpha/beta fold hydrolase [Candidatus Competibacteraceae bacterium]